MTFHDPANTNIAVDVGIITGRADFVDRFRSIAPNIPDWLRTAFEDEVSSLLEPGDFLPSSQYYYSSFESNIQAFINDPQYDMNIDDLRIYVLGEFPELYSAFREFF